VIVHRESRPGEQKTAGHLAPSLVVDRLLASTPLAIPLAQFSCFYHSFNTALSDFLTLGVDHIFGVKVTISRGQAELVQLLGGTPI
jgi:hypothetical protein